MTLPFHRELLGYFVPQRLPLGLDQDFKGRSRAVGQWSEDKLFVWHKYIQTTTTAMVGSRAWSSGLCYVDLFCGPGVCRVLDSSKRLPGSPLIAAMAPKPFAKILLCDIEPVNAAACEERPKAFGTKNVRIWTGDSNTLVNEIARSIPPGALTLAFLDPEGLDVRFETVRALSTAGQVDLLILFADAYDAIRNLDRLLDGSDKRLDLMLAPDSNWKEEIRALPKWEGNTPREFFAAKYIDDLKRCLGYQVADSKVICGPRGPLYRLVYASKHVRGLDFWRKVDFKDRHGQSELFGP